MYKSIAKMIATSAVVAVAILSASPTVVATAAGPEYVYWLRWEPTGQCAPYFEIMICEDPGVDCSVEGTSCYVNQ